MISVTQTKFFASWKAGLRDRRAAKRIDTAIFRLRRGLGNVKRLSPLVSEVKIDHEPGYRLYFTRRGSELIILLCGGVKGSQQHDIEKAEEMAAEIR